MRLKEFILIFSIMYTFPSFSAIKKNAKKEIKKEVAKETCEITLKKQKSLFMESKKDFCYLSKSDDKNKKYKDQFYELCKKIDPSYTLYEFFSFCEDFKKKIEKVGKKIERKYRIKFYDKERNIRGLIFKVEF